MAYTKTVWVARQGNKLNKFTKSEETPTSVVLANSPESVTQAGTPFSVGNMNKIEQGVDDAHTLIKAVEDALPYGNIVSFPFSPSPLQLAAWRCLPLEGGVYLISRYQRLFDLMYVGNALNATAEWWYKTSDAQGNIRDVNGAYMRVLDHRGLFSRASGINGTYKMANDAPYNGGSIGAKIGDAIRNITGLFVLRGSQTPPIVLGSGGVFYYNEDANTYYNHLSGDNGTVLHPMNMHLDVSRTVPTANENRPASISSYLCIKY
jgi:hypothetical protein